VRAFADLNKIRSAVGSEIGVSWVEVTPDRIDLFAAAAYDEDGYMSIRIPRRPASPS
jgi:hypothetical protein